MSIVPDIQINEASGLAASRLHPGVLYTHNDSGDRARIFALDSEDGRMLAQYQVLPADHHDWEDMAVGVCPSEAGSCIYIGKLVHFCTATLIGLMNSPEFHIETFKKNMKCPSGK